MLLLLDILEGNIVLFTSAHSLLCTFLSVWCFQILQNVYCYSSHRASERRALVTFSNPDWEHIHFSCSLWSLLTSTSWEKPDPLPVLLVAVSPVKEMIHCFRMIHTQHLVSLTLFTCVLCLCERVISVCVCVFSHAILFIFFYMWYCVFLFLQTCELARRLSEGDVHFEWTEAETIVLNRLPVNGVCACRRQ